MTTVEFVGFPKIARLAREIVVTEKIDGCNGVVYIGEDGEVLAGSRNRWLVPRSRGGGADNHGFAEWVDRNTDDLRRLGPGRHYGEWWGYGINRGYGLPKGVKRFSLFDTLRWIADPDEIGPACCHHVPILYQGPFLTDAIESCLDRLRVEGSVAAPGFMKPEGVVVFHSQGRVGFKKTIENDEAPYKGWAAFLAKKERHSWPPRPLDQVSREH